MQHVLHSSYEPPFSYIPDHNNRFQASEPSLEPIYDGLKRSFQRNMPQNNPELNKDFGRRQRLRLDSGEAMEQPIV